ncbi:hypothetical protein VSR34_36870 [Paraburkholderia sp. JHI2823]|uniref:hypothetical protein n=1 Tax=Paraburkholderia sp. JHI2823 TaxID=3112960 RepID=UPI00316BFC38
MWIAKRDLAQWTYTHNQQLVEKGAATAQALEQSQSDLKSAQATLTSISAQIEKTEQTLVSDQADLNHTAITAPISGLVISPTSSVYGTTWTKQDIAHLKWITVAVNDTAQLNATTTAITALLHKRHGTIDFQVQSMTAGSVAVRGQFKCDACRRPPDVNRQCSGWQSSSLPCHIQHLIVGV